MDEEQISKAIVEILINEGYGRTAAQLAVSPITIAIFQAAFELGEKMDS